MALGSVEAGKVAVIVATFVLSILGSWAPWLIQRLRRALLVMEVCCCFASGVILGAFLCHLLPDAEDAWSQYSTLAGVGSSYPFPQLICGCALICLVWVDRALVHSGLDGHGGDGHGHDHSHAVPSLPASYADPEAPKPHDSIHDHLHEHGHAHNHAHDHAHSHDSRLGAGRELTDPNPHSHDAPTVPQYDPSQPSAEQESLEKSRGSRQSVVDAYVFFFALSVHSIFDGLGVGAEEDGAGFWALAVAVLVHKALDGFALGVPLFFANLGQKRTVLAILFCASMTPLGVGVGWAATDAIQGANGQLAKAIILSMTSGTFLFISLVELLPSAMRSGTLVHLKMVVFVVGFGLMAALAVWV